MDPADRAPDRGDRPPLAEPSPFPPFPVERSERLYHSVWCGLRRDWLRLDDGDLQEHHVVEIPDAVVVVPRRTDGRFVMIWQHRHPHGGSGYEMPAGRIHADETPAQAAARELREETGYGAGSLVPLPGFYPIHGISDHFAHAFLALDCEEEGDLQLDRAERLSVHLAGRDELEQAVRCGQIRDAFSSLALFHALALTTPEPGDP